MINGKSVEELIAEGNKAIEEAKEMSEDEMAEEDAEAGYFDNDD